MKARGVVTRKGGVYRSAERCVCNPAESLEACDEKANEVQDTCEGNDEDNSLTRVEATDPAHGDKHATQVKRLVATAAPA